jgi:hypothetical protein
VPVFEARKIRGCTLRGAANMIELIARPCRRDALRSLFLAPSCRPNIRKRKMSAHRSIPIRAVAVLREISKMIQNKAPITRARLRDYCRSSYVEVQACVLPILIEHPDLLDRSCGGLELEWAIDFCVGRAIVDEQNDYVPNRAESLEYLKALFFIIIKYRRFGEQVQHFVDALATFVRQADAKTQDLVVLIVLEHIFQMPEARRVFARWKIEAALAPLYSEGVRLAKSWKTEEVTMRKSNSLFSDRASKKNGKIKKRGQKRGPQ